MGIRGRGFKIIPIFLALVGIPKPTLGEDKSLKLNAFEVIPPTFQMEYMNQDKPLKDLYITEDGHVIILGNKFLWQLNVEKNNLKKISLPVFESENLEIQGWLPREPHIILVSHNLLYDVSLSKKSAFKVRVSQDRSLPSLGLISHPKGAVWIHRQALYLYQKESQKVKKLAAQPPMGINDQYSLGRTKDHLWIIRNKFLLEMKLDIKKSVLKILQKGFDRFTQIIPFSGHFILLSKQAVLVLGKKGNLKRAIPVNKPREILAMDLGERFHIYFLGNGIIELYETPTLSKFYFTTKGEQKKPTKVKIKGKGPIVAAIINGTLRTYVLSLPSFSSSISTPPSFESDNSLSAKIY